MAFRSELRSMLRAGKLEPTENGDPSSQVLFAFLSVLGDIAGADGEAYYLLSELAQSVHVSARTITRCADRAYRGKLLRTRSRGYAKRCCSTYVLELGRTSAELGRPLRSVEVLQGTEGPTSLELENSRIVLEAYRRALKRKHKLSCSLEPEAPVLGALSAWLGDLAEDIGSELGPVADAAMAAYMAHRGMADEGLERACHRLDWWTKYQHVLELGVRNAFERTVVLPRPMARVSSDLSVPFAQHRSIVAELASGKFPALRSSSSEHSPNERKRVASAGDYGRLSASTPS